MSVNKKSIATQALMEMDDLKNAIKEESKSTIKTMLSEAVKDALRESVDEDDDMVILEGKNCGKDEKCKKGSKDCCGKKSCNGKKSGLIGEAGEEDEMAAQQTGAMNQAYQDQAGQAQAAMNAQMPQATEAGVGEEGQDDFAAQYQAGDEDTLDLTGEQDIQNVLKVYKSLSDDDQVVVKQEGNKINLQDNGTGAEYIIDLGGDDEAYYGDEYADEMAPEEMYGGEAEQLAEGYDLGYDEDEPEDYDDYDGEDDDYDDYDDLDAEDEDNFKNKETMNDKDTIFEIDLGYTDNYQDKDPIDGLSNSEPSKSGRSWHKGIPTGTEKPWAGKGTEKKGDPFGKSVNENLTELDDDYFAAGLNDTGVADVELEDGMPFDKKVGSLDEGGYNVGGAAEQRAMGVKSRIPNGRKAYGPQVKHHVSTENEYEAEVNEAISKLKSKNKKLNEAVKDLHKGLKEAYMTNVNLGKITKLFLENATTQAEKLQIVERFSNEAKTPKQAQALYESISKQLANSKKTNLGESKTSDGKAVVNESKGPAYKSQDLLNTIDLMKRVMNC